jgi:hypothetical protein
MYTTQRWRAGRDRYRPAGETIRTRDYEVAPIPDNATARRFVLEHHYSGSYPAARFRLGLYWGPALVGVAIFSHPCTDRALAVFPGPAAGSVELGRFVLLDEVPGNGESWFLGRCFAHLRRLGLRGVVSFCDPLPRRAQDGRLVFPGHIGTIYQAHNGRYLGRSAAYTLRLFRRDGRALSPRALSKLRCRIANLRAGRADPAARRRERGWRYVADALRTRGADDPAGLDGPGLEAWLGRWLAALTVTVRHPGNHKYAWPLDRHCARHLPAGRPYPKLLHPTGRMPA